MPSTSVIQLANQDNLRINVLLAQKPLVIRINESNMTLYALTARGEVSIKLHSTVKDDQYLRWVRELLSMKVTGSPGGYPIFIKRWTRMGHTQNTLEHMLLLGEPEAIIAAAYAKELSHDIAERIWWACSSTEIARQLLKHNDIVEGALGIELAKFLMEFLPFEERQLDVVDTVRLCLQGNLITQKQRLALWKRAKRKNPYYIGFIHASMDLIPETRPATAHYTDLAQKLAPLLKQNNPYAIMLVYLQSKQGQKWLLTLKYALYKPVDRDVVISLFIAVGESFHLPWTEFSGVREISYAIHRASDYCQAANTASSINETIPNEVGELVALLDRQERQLLEASLVLTQLGEDTLIPVFSGNDSVGSVMRRRMLPVTTPILERIDILMS
jgi:hypothetical protein